MKSGVLVRQDTSRVFMNKKYILANCRECGSLFVKTDRLICKKCFQKEYALLIKLNNIILDNPNYDINKVLEFSGISKDKFNKLLNHGKFWSYNKLEIRCKFCKKPITANTGRQLCFNCYSDIAKVSSSAKKVKESRDDMFKKAYRLRQYQKTSTKEFPSYKKYGHPNKIRNHFLKNITAVETEILPDINQKSSVKLSSTHGFLKVAI